MDAVTFADFPANERAAALNRVFQGYVLPFEMSEEQFAVHIRTNDIDLQASPVFLNDGTVAAATLVAIRGERSWIGGFGVSPELRGRGLGRKLINAAENAARERGAAHMQLEVLQHNPAAIALYESSGFTRMRPLYSFRVDLGRRTAAGVAEATLEKLLRHYTQAEPACWQREPASLRNQRHLFTFETNGGAAAIRHNGTDGQLSFAAANSAETFYGLLEGTAQYCGIARLVLFNEPGDSPLTGWATQADWPMPFAQYEMAKAL